MALAAIKLTVGQSLGDGRYGTVIKGASVPAVSTTQTDVAAAKTAAALAVADAAAVAAAVAALVADGASPTQAHVTTLNSAWGTLNADISAANTAAGTAKTDADNLATAFSGDVTITWDASVVTHRNQMRHALHVALRAIEAGYGSLAE